ncbi:MAG: NifU family protein [Lawsonella sp.]
MSDSPILFYSRSTPDPLTLEWVVEPGLLRFQWEGGAGDAAEGVELGVLPFKIARYLDAGELSHLRLQPGRIFTTIPEDGDWRAIAGRLRRDLYEVLTDRPEGWPTGDLPVESPQDASDAELAQAVEELIAGSAGNYASTHGGRMALRSVKDGVVKVHMSGACTNCPAAKQTLSSHIEMQLKHHFKNLKAVLPD